MLCPDVPLVDLHRHLEGSVRLETMLDLARQHELTLPGCDVETLRTHVQMTEAVSEPSKAERIWWTAVDASKQVFVDYDACQRITIENLEDAVQEGIDYIELRFSPLFMSQAHNLDPMGAASAVCDAWQESCTRLPVRSKLIIMLHRNLGPEASQVCLDAAISHRDRGVVAVDLAGDPRGFAVKPFSPLFRRAREAGLRITAHAGEAEGPESIPEAVLELGAERLGHAIGMGVDSSTMQFVVERGIAIEFCPSMYVLFGMVPGYRALPLRTWLQHGLLVTLNTDDPSISGVHLPEVYRAMRDDMGLSEAELRRLQQNGLKAAFLTDQERMALLQAKDRGSSQPIAADLSSR